MLLLIIASMAQATPTYLSCELKQDSGPLVVEVVADEQNGKAIVSLPSGRVVERMAIFSPAEVRVMDEGSTWSIDRANLNFKRTLVIGEEKFESAGTCKLAPAPAKRAF